MASAPTDYNWSGTDSIECKGVSKLLLHSGSEDGRNHVRASGQRQSHDRQLCLCTRSAYLQKRHICIKKDAFGRVILKRGVKHWDIYQFIVTVVARIGLFITGTIGRVGRLGRVRSVGSPLIRGRGIDKSWERSEKWKTQTLSFWRIINNHTEHSSRSAISRTFRIVGKSIKSDVIKNSIKSIDFSPLFVVYFKCQK